MIDVNGLVTFTMIAEERSFSRAADRLGIAQSIVSKRLRRLEDAYGAVLVDRSIRTRIALTRVGELFLPAALETLTQLRTSDRVMRGLARGTAGPLRIGFVFSAALNGTLTTLLRALTAAMPEISLKLRMFDTPDQLAALNAAQLDIALVRPRLSYPEQCTAATVHTEALVLCLSHDCALAGIGEIRACQLAGQNFIIPQFHEQVGLLDNIRSLAQTGNFSPPPIIRTGDFVTAACLAAARAGVVLAPRSLQAMALDGIVFREIVDFRDHVDTVLVYRHDAPAAAIEEASRALRSQRRSYSAQPRALCSEKP